MQLLLGRLLAALSNSNGHSDSHADHGVVACAQEATEASQSGLPNLKQAHFLYKSIVFQGNISASQHFDVDKCGQKKFVHVIF